MNNDKIFLGYSGCDIKLIQNKNKEFIRKISKDISYNDRLYLQFDKQKLFKSESIKSVEVFNYGYIDSKFYFDMQYINSNTLSSYIEANDINLIKYHATRIAEYIKYNKQNSIQYCDSIKIKQKINELEKTINNYNIIDLLYQTNWENIPVSYCHGDLSFDNILIYNNEIYFIDFLDSFINSWTIDVAKILQETRYLWSYRYKNINKILIVKLKYFEEIILDILNITDSEIITINKIIYLNIVRILPYVKDEITKNYIYNNINKIKGKI